MKIIAHMVGRNESDRYLEEVLAHVRPLVDMITFTDDASTDKTPEIAEEYGAIVKRLATPLFSTHEGRLRTEAWNHLEQYAEPGDWVLALDCDEKLYGAEYFSNLLYQRKYDVLGIKFYHMWNETQYRIDKAWKPNNSTRLFRYIKGGKFADRKLACGAEPLYVQDWVRGRRFFVNTGLRMQHLGYMRDEDKLAKYKRYMQLDGGNFHALAHLRSIIDANPTLENWVDD